MLEVRKAKGKDASARGESPSAARKRRTYQAEWQRRYRDTEKYREHQREYRNRPENVVKNKARCAEWRGGENAIRHLAKRYGLTVAQHADLVALSNGHCRICWQVPTRPVVDHDHKTGAVRGILCHKCNTAIGMLSDDPARCRAAALYLEGIL